MGKDRYLAVVSGGFKRGKVLDGKGDHRKEGKCAIIQHWESQKCGGIVQVDSNTATVGCGYISRHLNNPFSSSD